jgi:hypothetical protein
MKSLCSIAGLLVAILGLQSPAHAAGRTPVVFTHGPTDIANAAGIRPLGNLNPGGRHVLAVNHMYIDYPFPDTAGAYAYPVYAMAEGEITMISRQQVPGRPDLDYQIFIRHADSLTTYYDHVHGLSAAIAAAIAGVSWSGLGGGNSILFGAPGAPAPLPVHAGEQVGITKSYSFSWDVGVVDARFHQHFAGHGPARYPDFDDFRGLLRKLGLEAPYAGNRTENAACFIDYLDPAIRPAWFALLVSTPKTCGSDAWDVDGRLRGAWFNPALDALSRDELLQGVDIDRAALSVIPYNLEPLARVQIGIGSGTPYAAFDPSGAIPQLRSPLLVDVDFTPGARINPDPAAVGPATGTVCYDVSYNDFGGTHWNTIRFRMQGGRRVAIKLDATPQLSPQCAATPLAEPDPGWIVYVR